MTSLKRTFTVLLLTLSSSSIAFLLGGSAYALQSIVGRNYHFLLYGSILVISSLLAWILSAKEYSLAALFESILFVAGLKLSSILSVLKENTLASPVFVVGQILLSVVALLLVTLTLGWITRGYKNSLKSTGGSHTRVRDLILDDSKHISLHRKPVDLLTAVGNIVIAFFFVFILGAGHLAFSFSLGFLSLSDFFYFGGTLLVISFLATCSIIFYRALADIGARQRGRISNAIAAFLISYFAVTIFSAYIFWMAYGNNPSHFTVIGSRQLTFLDFVFFSLATITTLGDQTIIPNSLDTKLIIMCEVGFGFTIGAVFLGFLISAGLTNGRKSHNGS